MFASMSSCRAGLAISHATRMMKSETIMAPAASIQDSDGKKCAAAIATATGMELIASDLWCQAFASSACELTDRATRRVHLKIHSFAKIETSAQKRAGRPGDEVPPARNDRTA